MIPGLAPGAVLGDRPFGPPTTLLLLFPQSHANVVKSAGVLQDVPRCALRANVVIVVGGVEFVADATLQHHLVADDRQRTHRHGLPPLGFQVDRTAAVDPRGALGHDAHRSDTHQGNSVNATDALGGHGVGVHVAVFRHGVGTALAAVNQVNSDATFSELIRGAGGGRRSAARVKTWHADLVNRERPRRRTVFALRRERLGVRVGIGFEGAGDLVMEGLSMIPGSLRVGDSVGASRSAPLLVAPSALTWEEKKIPATKRRNKSPFI